MKPFDLIAKYFPRAEPGATVGYPASAIATAPTLREITAAVLSPVATCQLFLIPDQQRGLLATRKSATFGDRSRIYYNLIVARPDLAKEADLSQETYLQVMEKDEAVDGVLFVYAAAGDVITHARAILDASISERCHQVISYVERRFKEGFLSPELSDIRVPFAPLMSQILEAADRRDRALAKKQRQAEQAEAKVAQAAADAQSQRGVRKLVTDAEKGSAAELSAPKKKPRRTR